jgi:hypothetical protein
MVKTKDSSSSIKNKDYEKQLLFYRSDEPGDPVWLSIDKIIYRLLCGDKS